MVAVAVAAMKGIEDEDDDDDDEQVVGRLVMLYNADDC